MGEGFIARVESIERLVTGCPQISSVILQQFAYIRTSQALLVAQYMIVSLERVAIVMIYAKRSRDPQKSEIALHPGGRCSLPDSISRREGPEPDTLPLGKCY